MLPNSERIYDGLQNFDFSTLFIDELSWNPPATTRAIDIDDYHIRYAIARFMNVTIFEIKNSSGTIPDAQTRDYLYKELSYLFPKKLLIFIDKDRTQSLWYWSKRKENKQENYQIFYFKGQPADIFLHKIKRMLADLGATETVSRIETQINQVSFYDSSKEEIAEYFCRQTIHRIILTRIKKQGILNIEDKKAFNSIDEMLIKLNEKHCHQLLFKILPELSVLDPACGNGLFLIAVLNTLSNIYGPVIAKIEQFGDSQFTDWLYKIRAEHANINCYIRQRIVTENLFGVDIDIEAIQNTCTKLLHAINSSQRSSERQVELSDIGFNIRVGNALIGLLHTQNNEEIKQLNSFHWGYEFEHIMDEHGGFDVIITDPPWEILKQSDQSLKFWRSNAEYEYQGARSPVNLYKLFIERCYKLLCDDGQCGMLVPSGIYSDQGTQKLREMLFEKTQISGLLSFENRQHILPEVNSLFKFVLLTFAKGGPTEVFPAAFNRHDVEELVDFPSKHSIQIPTSLIRRLSPDICALLEFQSTIELQICEKMLQYPFLGKKIEGRWNVVLAQELHATQDNYIIHNTPDPEYLPLYEGRMIQQFTLQPAQVRYWMQETDGRAALLQHKTDTGQQLSYQKYRLGYRSISRSSDSRTLIATILPPNTFASNNLCITSNNLTSQELLFLVAMLNSFVLDFMLRLRSSMHVGMFHLHQLPLPRLTKKDKVFLSIVERAAHLVCVTPDFKELWNNAMPTSWSPTSPATTFADRMRTHTSLDALIAHLYNLTQEEFRYILMTFTLVSEPIKLSTENAYEDIERGLIQ